MVSDRGMDVPGALEKATPPGQRQVTDTKSTKGSGHCADPLCARGVRQPTLPCLSRSQPIITKLCQLVVYVQWRNLKLQGASQ